MEMALLLARLMPKNAPETRGRKPLLRDFGSSPFPENPLDSIQEFTGAMGQKAATNSL